MFIRFIFLLDHLQQFGALPIMPVQAMTQQVLGSHIFFLSLLLPFPLYIIMLKGMTIQQFQFFRLQGMLVGSMSEVFLPQQMNNQLRPFLAVLWQLLMETQLVQVHFSSIDEVNPSSVSLVGLVVVVVSSFFFSVLMDDIFVVN